MSGMDKVSLLELLCLNVSEEDKMYEIMLEIH